MCFIVGLQEIQVREFSLARVMSQKANPSPAPTPSVVKSGKKGLAALLAVIVSLAAFTSVTIAYVVFPYFQGSNSNGGRCTTNCRGSLCGAGCLQAAITGNNNPSSPYIQLLNLNATSSTTLKMTLRAVGASQLDFYSAAVTDTSTTAYTFESCQQCGFFSNYSSVLWVTASPTQGSLTFKAGDNYTLQLSDSGNSSTYYFHF